MKIFKLDATNSTPDITGSVTNGKVEIRGMCRPENSVTYFHPFINWMHYFMIARENNVQIILDIDYINTSSGMLLFKILANIKATYAGKNLDIVWMYDTDDDDGFQVGVDFRYMLGEVLRLAPKETKRVS